MFCSFIVDVASVRSNRTWHEDRLRPHIILNLLGILGNELGQDFRSRHSCYNTTYTFITTGESSLTLWHQPLTRETSFSSLGNCISPDR
jgi:hypothetical protein